MLRCVQRITSFNTRACQRSFSAGSILQKKQEEFDFSLPPARVRALITLYHRSADFITYDNLSERIDEAFTDPTNTPTLAIKNYSYGNLLQDVEETRQNPGRQGLNYRGVPLEMANRDWSNQQGMRDAIINRTLWGVEINKRPGLETVLETSALNEKEQSSLEATAGSTTRVYEKQRGRPNKASSKQQRR